MFGDPPTVVANCVSLNYGFVCTVGDPTFSSDGSADVTVKTWFLDGRTDSPFNFIATGTRFPDP